MSSLSGCGLNPQLLSCPSEAEIHFMQKSAFNLPVMVHVRSFRAGSGKICRGEVGIIATAMGTSTETGGA
jgi:hypothetical protein